VPKRTIVTNRTIVKSGFSRNLLRNKDLTTAAIFRKNPSEVERQENEKKQILPIRQFLPIPNDQKPAISADRHFLRHRKTACPRTRDIAESLRKVPFSGG
jgi:hypothetical protein